MRSEYNELVNQQKENYLSNLGSKISDPRTGSKKYWTCLKTFLNKNKASLIPPILDHGVFITDIKEKCQLFNSYFKSQCTIVDTSSFLPEFIRKTELSLEKVSISPNQIKFLLSKLQVKKSHGHDELSASILKLCGDSIVEPLFLIYSNCLNKGIFPKIWKKANVVAIHKKKEKNLTSNYRPISLLPLCGKIFEKIIYNSLYSYIYANKFISDKQSGYKRGDSTIKQLISITHEIHKYFDEDKEVRAVFLDISRAFDRVWHEGLIFKLKQIGIQGEALNIIKNFLSDREQRVTIDGQSSDWTQISAGVPQGSILGPLLFLIFINDITEVVSSDIRIFADDTFIFREATPDSTTLLNDDLAKITQWAWQWKMLFNPDISKQAVEVIFSNKSNPTTFDPLTFHEIPVKQVSGTTHLGMSLDYALKFKDHIYEKLAKARQGLGLMKLTKKWLSHKVLEVIYKAFVRPNLDYGDVVYHCARTDKPSIFESESTWPLLKQVESVQYDAAKIVTGAWHGTNIEKLYKMLGWESLNKRRIMRKLTILHETQLTKTPAYLNDIISKQKHTSTRLSSQLTFREIVCKKSVYKRSFFPSTISDWNQLAIETRKSRSKAIFKNRLLREVRPKKQSFFGLFHNSQIRYLTLLRMNLSPLNAHRNQHKFANVDPFCVDCGNTEDTEHYLLKCKNYTSSRATMFQNLKDSNIDVSALPGRTVLAMLLFGSADMTYDQNTKILKEVTNLIKKTKRLDVPLYPSLPNPPSPLLQSVSN